MSGAAPDPDITERWRSYQYRRLMHVSVEQFEATPTLTVDWDLAMHTMEARLRATAQANAAAGG